MFWILYFFIGQRGTEVKSLLFDYLLELPIYLVPITSSNKKPYCHKNPSIPLFFLIVNYFPFSVNAQLTVHVPVLSVSQQRTTLCACAHSLLCVCACVLLCACAYSASYSSLFGTTQGACVQINTRNDVSFLWSLVAITNSVYSVSPWSECENILALSITKVAHP